jgi:hypothetical protein
MNGSHDVNDLLQAAQMFVHDLPNDNGMVPSADLARDLLEHRPVTTFLQTNLVSVDGSVMGTVKDPNLVNPWGMSDTTARPAWTP